MDNKTPVLVTDEQIAVMNEYSESLNEMSARFGESIPPNLLLYALLRFTVQLYYKNMPSPSQMHEMKEGLIEAVSDYCDECIERIKDA